MKPWWERVGCSSVVEAWVTGLLILGCILLITSMAHAELRDPDHLAMIPPNPDSQDGYVYREDPCVDILRKAMLSVEPYLPELREFRFRDGFWFSMLQVTDTGMYEFSDAMNEWREAKITCFQK